MGLGPSRRVTKGLVEGDLAESRKTPNWTLSQVPETTIDLRPRGGEGDESFEARQEQAFSRHAACA